MKKLILFIVLLSSFASIGFAGSVTKTTSPHVIIKALYKAQKAGTGPFFQTKSRALVDRYFQKGLADLIWKDALKANGEVGRLDFDPLFGVQDPTFTDLVIMDTGWGGDAKFGPADEAVVQVTFKLGGKERMVSYRFHQQKKTKLWKIYDIRYVATDTEPERFLKAVLSGKE